MENRKEITTAFEENVEAIQNAYGASYHALSTFKKLPEKATQEEVAHLNRSLNIMMASVAVMLVTFERNQSRLDYLTSKN